MSESRRQEKVADLEFALANQVINKACEDEKLAFCMTVKKSGLLDRWKDGR